MTLTADMIEMLWVGVWLSVKFLGVTFLWCLLAGIINKSVGG